MKFSTFFGHKRDAGMGLKVFLLGNNQFPEADCKLELDIMYTHAFFVLRTVTLPVHYDDACWHAARACSGCIITIMSFSTGPL